MRNIESRLAKLEDQLRDRLRRALNWLMCLCRTIQGCKPEARASRSDRWPHIRLMADSV